ncbi:hypothetical protein [Dactylosporangium darangshiense]|uniref:hypothetical protein n=1 Tax=Dactylosporangium darangshiense TaxID=579108 RepID=UPI0036427DA8
MATAVMTAGQIRFVKIATTSGTSEVAATYGVKAISCTAGKPLSSPNTRAPAHTTNGSTMSQSTTPHQRRRRRTGLSGSNGRVSSVVTIPPE